jgi:hypothetical protein
MPVFATDFDDPNARAMLAIQSLLPNTPCKNDGP